MNGVFKYMIRPIYKYEVNAKRGKHEKAQADREEAKRIVERIAESLREL